jgi:hypothetical protein
MSYLLKIFPDLQDAKIMCGSLTGACMVSGKHLVVGTKKFMSF